MGWYFATPFFPIQKNTEMKQIRFLLLGLLSLGLWGCGDDSSSTVEIIRPTNLRMDLNVSNSTEGLVEISMTANFTNYYRVFIEEGSKTVILDSQDGQASYTFSESGTYTIRGRAYASFEYYAEVIDSVSVEVSSGGGGGGGGIPTTGYTTPLTYPGYTLVWNDEFEGSSLSSDWTHEIGTGGNGWGNNELQYYRAENTEVKDGYLVITAKNETFGGRNYTSSRIVTRGMQSFKYGRIDIRAALPEGQGLWPALWMLGDNFNSVGWPACGEIDIMEMVGGNGPNRGDEYCFGTVHWDNNGTKADFGGSIRNSSGKLSQEFHVYSIVWDANAITWYFDDTQFHQIDITPAALSEFQEKFFFIFNVAVGGDWPGSPNASTVFPQQMAVDYVRVFQ